MSGLALVQDEPLICSECYNPVTIADGGMCAKCRAYARSEAGDQLAQRLTVPELVETWRRAESDVRAAFAMVARAEKSLDAAFTLDGTFGLRVRERRNCRIDFNDAEGPLLELRRSIWSHLVDRLEIRRMMSIKAWTELEKQLEGKEIPEITEEAVRAMVAQYSAALPSMLEDAIVEVFDWLRPPNSDYKTNSEFEIGKRVCLEGVLDTFLLDLSGKLKVGHWSQPRLTALENVFSALAGEGSITKTHYGELTDAIPNAGFPCSGETLFFKFRGFKNRSLHLEFKRLDLLKKFNTVAGGKRLRQKSAT